MIDDIIGSVIARRVEAELGRSGGPGGPKLVVTNFKDGEVAAALAGLERFQLPGATKPVTLVVDVAGEAHSTVPPAFRLSPERSLTWFRNNSREGLVLFSLGEASDRQGLGQLYRMTDRSLLDPPVDSAIDPSAWLVKAAWEAAGPGGLASAPDALFVEAATVYSGVTAGDPVGLRLWTRYVLAVSRRLRARNRAATAIEVRDALGIELTELDMFPSRQLFADPRKAGSLLARNRHCSAGRDPKGRQVPEGYLLQRIEELKLDAGQLGRDAAGIALLKDEMAEFARTLAASARRQIDFADWSLLFDKTVRRQGLGARIRLALEPDGPHASLLDDLDVEGDLDDGDPDAATAVLEAETPAGDALADVLPAALRRRLERIAVPPSRVEVDPLLALLRHLVNADDMPADAEVRLRVDAAPGRTGERSLAVFRLLFARTLRDVAEQSELGDGRRLVVDVVLSEIAWPPDAVDDDDVDLVEDPWNPVYLGLWMADEETPRYRFRWEPDDRDGYAALAATVRGCVIPEGSELAMDVEAHATQMSAMLVEPDARRPAADVATGLAAQWASVRTRHFAEWAESGMSPDAITAYVDEWTELLALARDQLVPENSPLPALDDFLDTDMVRLAGGRAALRASHPLRLRWLAGHLGKLSGDLSAALSGAFEVNAENDHLYFDSIGRVSAHRQPPMLVAGTGEVLAAAREFGLHEEYASVGQAGESEAWIGAVDEGAIDSLADTVDTYLSSFPYKLDGLGLLLLVKDGDARLADLLVRRLARTHGAALVMELHVVAPRAQHQAVALALSDPASDGDRESQLLPRMRLTVHDWPETFAALLDQLEGRIDLALVPNLFGAHTQLQAKTRPRAAAVGGRFDPWLDAASHAAPVSGGGGENVSRILLPAAPDPILEAWSTLSVRRYLQSAVAPDTPDNTDYLTLQVTFDRNRILFERLHDVAHWVVTLDPFVGRDQIDALESPPDVILVRTGLGKNKTHTLVVSSRSGRRFVVRGLERRLRAILGFATAEESAALAERLYELARNTVPGIVLRALGLGRGLEEILGLTVTRFAVEEHFAMADAGDGMEWWLSLDDHLSWFGGAHRLRADLLRVLVRIGDDEMRMDLEVVESKFRQQEDIGAADQQLDRSLALLHSAFAPTSHDREASDAVFWRRELASALDETSRKLVANSDLPGLRVFGSRPEESLLGEIRTRLLNGDYSLGSRGIACALATSASGPVSRGTTPGGHVLLRMTRDSIVSVLDDIAEKREPSPADHLADVDDGPVNGNAVTTDPAPRRSALPFEAVLVEEASSDRGLSASELEARYQRVLDAFHEFRIDVTAPDGLRVDEGPGFYLARVVPGNGVSADKLMSRTTDLKLRLELPHELDIRTYADRGAVVFEIPKLDDERYDVDATALWARIPATADELAVAIGEDISGEAVVVNLSSSDSPHLLVAGTTGSGKSVALETILRGLCRSKGSNELQLHLIDPKGTELLEFEEDDHLAGTIGMDATDAIGTLTAAVTEMQRRYGMFKALRVRDLPAYNSAVAGPERLPWWLIVLDEYADLTADPDDKKELEALLRRLAQKARAAGLHVIVATQRPSADVISPVVRSNLPAQLALRVRTAVDSRVIIDQSGAEALAGRGDGLLRTARGIVRLQCARVGPP